MMNKKPAVGSTHLGRLANLLANRLPLIRLVFFDRVKQILTLR